MGGGLFKVLSLSLSVCTDRNGRPLFLEAIRGWIVPYRQFNLTVGELPPLLDDPRETTLRRRLARQLSST
jgi:hypothetical protein